MITERIMMLNTTSESRRLKPVRCASDRVGGCGEGRGKEISLI